MNLEPFLSILKANLIKENREFYRLFHGRGEAYEGFNFINIDSIDNILSVMLYDKKDFEEQLLKDVSSFAKESGFQTLIVQKRYLKNSPSELLLGELADEIIAIENGMKFKLNLKTNQNSLFFGDMKNGRAFVRANAKDKNVLNLFSYTCAFSVAAKLGGAATVVNVDMSKASLSIGKANHSLNNIDTKGVSFLPYNILKSISGIKKKSPFDLIIIDPPSYQKGSFEAKKDYIKIVKRLNELLSDDALVVACLNAPELQSNFLLDMFRENGFEFVQKIANTPQFVTLDNEKSLKVLIFKASKRLENIQ